MVNVVATRLDPDESRAKIEKLSAELARHNYDGGQAQIANNLEIQHIHRGNVQKVRIDGDHLVIDWLGPVVRIEEPAELLLWTVGDKKWVERLYDSPNFHWIISEHQSTYCINLSCLDWSDVSEDGKLTIRIKMANETVILLPKGSSLPLDLMAIGATAQPDLAEARLGARPVDADLSAPTPSDWGMEEAIDEFLRLHDDNFPPEPLQDFVSRCRAQGDEFFADVSRRVSFLMRPPPEIVKIFTEALKRRR